MAGASTLAGDSLGAPVAELTTATRVAAPIAPPTTTVAMIVAIPDSKLAPLKVAGHANRPLARGAASVEVLLGCRHPPGDEVSRARLRRRQATSGSSSPAARKAAHAAPRAAYQEGGGTACRTSPVTATTLRMLPSGVSS